MKDNVLLSSNMSNGSASEEKLVGEVSQNGKYTTVMGQLLSFKRRKVAAVRDFPPGCGPIAKPLRLEIEQEVRSENGNATDDSSVKETSEHLKVVDENLCNGIDNGVTMGNESHQANTPKQIKDKSDAFIVTPEDENVSENSSEVIRHEALEAQPLSICLPDDYENFNCELKPLVVVVEEDSVCERSIMRTKQLHGRKVDVVKDFSPNKGSKSLSCVSTLKKVPVSMEKNLVLKKSDPGELRAKADEKLGKRKIRDEESDSHEAGNIETQNMENLVRDIVIYTDRKSPGRDHLCRSISSEVSKPLELEKAKVTVSKPIHVEGRKKAKKGVANHSPLKLLKKKITGEYGEGSRMKNRESKNPNKKDIPDQELSRRPRTLEVGIPPSRSSGSSSVDSARHKIKETLRLFHGACRKILQEVEARPREKGGSLRVDCEAAKVLKSKGKYLSNGTPIMGPVPGVEVGDEFQYRMELNMLGIHRPSQAGIDSMKDNGELIAISIVASGGYDDELDNSDVLIYTGQGGNVLKGKGKGKINKDPEDQQLERGNLALATSVHKQNPVRVIRGNQKVVSESGDAKGRTYVYDGLYLVEEYWQETGSHGKLVFKFKLRRISGQPELSWKVMKKTKKFNFRDGLCKLDISEGKERLPICAVNEVDDEKPLSFMYTANMIYPDWCRPIPPKGCGCTTRCSESRNCACVAKNGGSIPYNYDGAVVEAKPLIYECGPLCKCPPSCYLRVTQRGIKFKLEVFKTELRGWGVRSLYSIPSGSFICEYAGELLEDKEAERRTGNDEYLFDIGNKFGNSVTEGIMLKQQLPATQLDDDTSGFTIDAEQKGNIGRFINHSCSPNLYAQNVLYDHEETRIPHVMFFAMDNIPPLQELSYDYNYTIDQVRDANGNIKKKNCYCGSSECTGRLY